MSDFTASYEVNAYELSSIINGYGDSSIDFIGNVEAGINPKVDFNEDILSTVYNADSSEYAIFNAISFFRERKDHLSNSSVFRVEGNRYPDEFIVVTTQKVFKASSESGMKLLELAQESHDKNHEAEKQAKMDELLKAKTELEEKIENLKNS